MATSDPNDAGGPAGVTVEVVDPHGDDARYCLGRYYDDLNILFDDGFELEKSLVPDAGEMGGEDGVFLVVYAGEKPVGCGGLKLLGGGVAYIKRMWIDPETRGRGLGRLLLERLESSSVELGCHTACLETNRNLVGAIAMYRSAGYRDVPAFNDEPYAHHWFEKELPGAAGSAPTLATARLDLRPFDYDDVDALVELFGLPDVRRYLLDDMVVPRAWVEDEVRSSRFRFREHGGGLWAVRRTGSEEIIGFVGFRPFFDPPRLQLLYGFDPRAWGRGLATEAARSVCDHSFTVLGLERIEAATDLPNEASARVLERLGMARTHETGEGQHGTAFFAVTRAEWQARFDA